MSVRRQAHFIVAVLLGGCGRVGFGTTDAATDAYDADDNSPVACNAIPALHDDFSAPLDVARWNGTFAATGTSVDTLGGELILTPATNTTDAYCGAGTIRHYDLRGQRFFAEVTQVGTNGAASGIRVERGTDRLDLNEMGGMLRAVYVAPTYTIVLERPYAAATDRYWSIAEAAGTIRWETSADGITFVPFAQAPAPFDVSLVRGMLYAGTEIAVAAPGAMHVASVGDASSTSIVCSSDELVDTFDTAVLSSRWLNSFSQPCCTFGPVNGQFVVTLDGTPGYAFLRSASGYDLRGRHVGVELVQAGPSGVTQALMLRRDPSNRIAIVVSATLFDAYEVVNGTSASHTTTRMTGERFLRIGESGGLYTAEVSADRLSWRTIRTAPNTFAFDDVMIELETGVPGSAIAPSTVIWDNFNVP